MIVSLLRTFWHVRLAWIGAFVQVHNRPAVEIAIKMQAMASKGRYFFDKERHFEVKLRFCSIA